jgi:tetratricopeptide (TPR) repeat protein
VAALGLNRVRQTRGHCFLNLVSQPRAATEGRPYSTSRGHQFIPRIPSHQFIHEVRGMSTFMGSVAAGGIDRVNVFRVLKNPVIIILVLIVAVARAQTGDVNLERLTEAAQAISDGQLPRAEQLLNSVLAVQRNDADALNLLGVVRAKQNRKTEAERLFRRALTSSPTHLGAHINLSELLTTTNRSAEALPILLGAHKLAPARSEITLKLAMLYADQRNYPQALQVLEEALASKPDDVATLRALARIARASGNMEKALSHLIEARRLAPQSPVVLYDFAVTTLQMDLVLDALPVFEQLHRDYPRAPAYLYGLAAAHWKKGETAETTRLLNEYVTVQPRDPSGWYLLGAALLRQEQTAEANAALEKSFLLKADPDTEYLLAVSFDKLGHRGVAIKRFQTIVQTHPEHAAAHAALGTIYREAGRYAEARSELERAVALDANDLRASYQLALVYTKLGEKAAAKKMFDRADDLRKRQHDQERVILKLIDPPQPN